MSSITLNGFLNAAVTKNISTLREQVADRAEEATTGRQADLVLHLEGRIDQALIGEQAVKQNADDKARLELRSIRLSIVDNTLTSIRDLTEGLSLQMNSAIGLQDSFAQDAVAAEAREALSEVLLRLDARHGERFLFSGDQTANSPFGDADVLLDDLRTIAAGATDQTDFMTQVETYFKNPTGGFQTTFYQGAQSASDPDSVLANQDAFVDLIQGLSVMALAHRNESIGFAQAGSPALDVALEGLERGRTSLVNVQADVGLRQASIVSEQTLLEREEVLLVEALRTLAGKDQYEAATQLKELETNLEAAYLLTARLANLSLTNYLR